MTDADQQAQPAPALSPLMQRVNEAQNNRTAEGVAIRRRWRHCFHEAAHAFVGHHYGEKICRIEVDVPAGQRQKANIGTKNLQDVFAAVDAHGKGAQEAVESVIRFLSYAVAGELLEIEVEQLLPPFGDRIKNEWDTRFRVFDSDLKLIVMLGQQAGFKHRNDLVQQAEERAKNLIVDHRDAFEALVIRLYHHGNIEQPELGEFLDA